MYDEVYSIDQLTSWQKERVLQALKGKTAVRQLLGLKKLIIERARIRRAYDKAENLFREKWRELLQRADSLDEKIKKSCLHPESEVRVARYQRDDTLGNWKPARLKIFCQVCQTELANIQAE